jgi:hypothetical protein
VEDRFEQLDRRFALLETELNRTRRTLGVWRTIAVGIIAVFGTGLAIAWASPGAQSRTVMGSFSVVTGANKPVVTINANGISYVSKGGVHWTLGRLPSGGAALRFYNGAVETASIGQGKEGIGGVYLFKKTGKLGIALGFTKSDDRGYFEIEGPVGPAVELSGYDHGYFALTNDKGTARVEAGTLVPEDLGIVRVFGPGGYDYIRGRK